MSSKVVFSLTAAQLAALRALPAGVDKHSAVVDTLICKGLAQKLGNLHAPTDRGWGAIKACTGLALPEGCP